MLALDMMEKNTILKSISDGVKLPQENQALDILKTALHLILLV